MRILSALGTAMLIRLVYISTAVKPMSMDALMELRDQARLNNAAKAITGILFYYNQSFLQVLEGEESTVIETFNAIKRDPRHRDVTQIEKTRIGKRDFQNWSMGLETLSDLDFQKLTGSEPETKKFDAQYLAANTQILHSLMYHFKSEHEKQVSHAELPTEHEDPVVAVLHRIIRGAVRILAILMALLILLGVIDVVYVMYEKLTQPPFLLMTIGDILAIFGSFMAVLIAIEIFINITLYLRSDVIPVKLVVATALMAIARKVIVFDFKELESVYVFATSAVVLALGITYWLITRNEPEKFKHR